VVLVEYLPSKLTTLVLRLKESPAIGHPRNCFRLYFGEFGPYSEYRQLSRKLISEVYKMHQGIKNGIEETCDNQIGEYKYQASDYTWGYPYVPQ
jgi:hypothetical protein